MSATGRKFERNNEVNNDSIIQVLHVLYTNLYL